MKRMVWVFAALCLVFVLSISAIADTTWGVRYKARGDDVWRDQQNGDVLNVETAYLYGTWRDFNVQLYGAGAPGDSVASINLVLSGDFDFKRESANSPYFFVFGGTRSSDPAATSDNVSVNVTGNSNAKIDLYNGGVEFYGGDHWWAGDKTTGSTSVSLTGDSPIFIPDYKDEHEFVAFGGSRVSGNNKHVSDRTGVTLLGPWKMADLKEEVYVGSVFGGNDAFNGATAVIKDRSLAYLENDNCMMSAIFGGGRAHNKAFSSIEGTTDLRLKKGSFERAVGGQWASGGSTAYASTTYVNVGNIKAIVGASVYGGGYAGSAVEVKNNDTTPSYSIVSGDTYILVEPKNGFRGRGVSRIYGGGFSRGPGMAEVRGSTNIVISGDAALEVIKPQDAEKDWSHISAGGYRRANTTVSNDVKGDGNITFKNITNIASLINNTAISGQGRIYDENMPAKLGFYENSVVGTSRLIYDNVKGTTGARTFSFDEIVFKNGSDVTFNRSISQLDAGQSASETATLIVEEGSTLRIAKDPTGETSSPTLGNAVINGTLIIEDGMTLTLNNSFAVGKGASVKGRVIVKKAEPAKPPVKPENNDVLPVKADMVNTAEELPANVAVLVEKQPNGELVVTPTKFIAAVASSDISGTVDTDLIKSMPVIKSTVSADKTALISFKARLDEFSAKRFSDLVLCKINPGKVLKFTLQSVPEKIKSGEFAVTAVDGKAVDLNGSPGAGTEYLITLAVADNSEYDLDPAKGAILDPAVLTVSKEKLTLSATELTLSVGESVSLKASGYAAGATLVWKNGDESVAAIEGSGAEVTVKALAVGRSDITVTDGAATVTCKVTVKSGTSGGGSGGGCSAGAGIFALLTLPLLLLRKRS